MLLLGEPEENMREKISYCTYNKDSNSIFMWTLI